MEQQQFIDALSRRLEQLMPAGLASARDELRQTLQMAVSEVLGRLDLVTREEFDVQASVLARTRTKVEALEARVAELEQALDERERSSADDAPG